MHKGIAVSLLLISLACQSACKKDKTHLDSQFIGTWVGFGYPDNDCQYIIDILPNNSGSYGNYGSGFYCDNKVMGNGNCENIGNTLKIGKKSFVIVMLLHAIDTVSFQGTHLGDFDSDISMTLNVSNSSLGGWSQDVICYKK